jgi:hypothetical protein
MLFYSSCKQYRNNIISIENCKNPEPPYITPLPFDLQIEIYKNIKGISLVKANLTVEKDITGLDKEGLIQIGKTALGGIQWKVSFRNLNCTSTVLKAMFQIFGVPIEGCELKKGNYYVKDLDFDVLDSSFQGMGRVYGEYVSKVAIFTKINTFICWMSHFSVVPLKKNVG